MPSVGFEPATPEIERLQTYALERTVIQIGANFDVFKTLNYTFCLDLLFLRASDNRPLFHLHRRYKLPAYTAYENGTVFSEPPAHKLQTPGNGPKEIRQYSEHGEG
jgi:hypothetical protein